MEEQVVQHEQQTGIVTSVQQYSGPLPPASELAAYKKVMVDAPERIVAMAEKEQSHRHNYDIRLLNAGRIESLLGQIFAFVIVLAFLAASIYLTMNNHEWVAITIIGIIAALATIFYLKKTPTEK